MQEQLIKKFIQAFNASYRTPLPSITLTDVDVPEETSKEIFTSLQFSLAVLYYQQLCDYFSENTPSHCTIDPRQEIQILLARHCDNEIYFTLFEAHYWGESPRLAIEKSLADRLQHVADIKYRLKVLEEERYLLQGGLNRLWECAVAFLPSELKDKTQQCVEALQTHLDDYLAQVVKSGIVIPIQACQPRDIKKEAGKEFLARVVDMVACYQEEFSVLASSLTVNAEDRSLYQLIRDCLHQFLSLLRRLFAPQRRVSTDFFRSKQTFCHPAQDFMRYCASVIEVKS
jgi:hypothetical protein